MYVLSYLALIFISNNNFNLHSQQYYNIGVNRQIYFDYTF